jgi:hypothetical protein
MNPAQAMRRHRLHKRALDAGSAGAAGGDLPYGVRMQALGPDGVPAGDDPAQRLADCGVPCVKRGLMIAC